MKEIIKYLRNAYELNEEINKMRLLLKDLSVYPKVTPEVLKKMKLLISFKYTWFSSPCIRRSSRIKLMLTLPYN